MITIVAAAIKLEEYGSVWSLPKPARHHHIIGHICRSLHLKSVPQWHTQGFLTSDGEFVNRLEGQRIALAAGQYRAGVKPFPTGELFSEDVW